MGDELSDAGVARLALPVEAACLRLWPSVGPMDVDWLCEQLRGLLTIPAAGPVICDVTAVTAPDIGTVEVLTRLQLTARRHGRSVQLRGQCRRLTELLSWTGLTEVLAAHHPAAGGQLPRSL